MLPEWYLGKTIIYACVSTKMTALTAAADPLISNNCSNCSSLAYRLLYYLTSPADFWEILRQQKYAGNDSGIECLNARLLYAYRYWYVPESVSYGCTSLIVELAVKHAISCTYFFWLFGLELVRGEDVASVKISAFSKWPWPACAFDSNKSCRFSSAWKVSAQHGDRYDIFVP